MGGVSSEGRSGDWENNGDLSLRELMVRGGRGRLA
jgi:hypothetical protein